MIKNTAGQVVGAQMITAADGTNFTGAVTVYVTGNNGTQTLGSVSSGAATHKGNGLHTYAPAQAETNYDHVVYTFIGTGAVTQSVQIYPQTAPTTPPTAGAIADAVWTETLADHSGVGGSTAAALAAAGSVGDPWATALPGSYSAGQAGKILGDNLNATVSSRLAAASAPANFSALSIDSNGRIRALVGITKNAGFANLLFLMTDEALHQPMTGLVNADFTKQYSLDGGSLTALTGTITEVGQGWYKITLTTTETNGNNVAYRFSAAGADVTNLSMVTSQ